MPPYRTLRSMAQSLQSVVARTEAARGAEYSSASSPKPLHAWAHRGCGGHRV